MARIAIDLTHKQRDWKGYAAFWNTLIPTMPQHTFELLAAPQMLDAPTLAQYDALVLALPCNAQITEPTISAIRVWITEQRKGLFLFSHYTGDTHHRTNLNQLARPLGVQFNEDLVLPHGFTAKEDGHAHVLSRDGIVRDAFGNITKDLVVRIDLLGGPLGAHPLMQGVHSLGFLSACSLDVTKPSLDFALTSPPDSSILKPRGERTEENWIIQIDPWVFAGKEAALLFAAFHSERGKIAACGSWKFISSDVITTHRVDNNVFIQNVIEWLVN